MTFREFKKDYMNRFGFGIESELKAAFKTASLYAEATNLQTKQLVFIKCNVVIKDFSLKDVEELRNMTAKIRRLSKMLDGLVEDFK
jgi:hypothetical protein